MRPSKFVASQERRLHRVLTSAELSAIQLARLYSQDGKRDTIRAMRIALDGVTPPPGGRLFSDVVDPPA